jgi:EAL domain-containing protein (putative c-di-GMP-specific phosphodiesterase class I)
LPPAEFIPLIDDSDLALEVGEWVIRVAIEQIGLWQREGFDLRISVNAFARHLLHPGFAETLGMLLKQHPEVRPEYLQIEIVETTALRDLDAIRAVIEDCGKLGVTFSLDDFGTGYSTLTHLRQLPATEIKIDKVFVGQMLDRREDRVIVEAIIGLGHAFNRAVVAEGAETSAHISRLLALGCDVIQGYALARPMAAEKMPGWVREFRLDPAWNNPRV